ncbi:Phosphoenolpyruvate carboxykinase [ATP] (EC [Olavius algarvensis Delta 1 endosymbiont]|nr:Phosphoenolpyruvate carboxykinase [ATP] (EC [Olavius algarvensis Delta 1 endosymbiont]
MHIDRKDGIPDFVTIGRKYLKVVHRNLPTPRLYEQIIKNREGQISHMGPVVVRTGDFAERSLADKFIVKEPASEEKVSWGGENRPISEARFNNLLYRLLAYMQNKAVYVQYCYAGRDPDHRTSIRFITETAWHNLFVRNMYTPIHDVKDFEAYDPDFTVVHIPGFHAMPEVDGTGSSAFVIVSLGQKAAFICGARYGGEIRQVVFTILNYLLPLESVFPLRCSANIGPDGDVAIFMGRGGTGKTSLAVDPERRLIGDHLHGWSDTGLFNFERGSYARVLKISREEETEIFACTRKFGSILENVSIDLETRRVDLNDDALTDNTRAVYPDSHIPNAVFEGVCDHPRNIFLLTCDALGVMPPIARLSPELAVYAFLSGYTSRFIETDSGPAETDIRFDTVFGASALTLPAHVYGNLLMEKIKKYNVTCWLLNTGWLGEPRGVGERIKIAQTRQLIYAAVSGKLNDAAYETDPVFSFEIPTDCPGVPAAILNPRRLAKDQGEYEMRAVQLAKKFMEDFARYENEMPENMRTMLVDVLSLDDTFDMLEEFRLSI